MCGLDLYINIFQNICILLEIYMYESTTNNFQHVYLTLFAIALYLTFVLWVQNMLYYLHAYVYKEM